MVRFADNIKTIHSDTHEETPESLAYYVAIKLELARIKNKNTFQKLLEEYEVIALKGFQTIEEYIKHTEAIKARKKEIIACENVQYKARFNLLHDIRNHPLQNEKLILQSQYSLQQSLCVRAAVLVTTLIAYKAWNNLKIN